MTIASWASSSNPPTLNRACPATQSGSFDPTNPNRREKAAIANHYIGHVSYRIARERLLAAGGYWVVTDDPAGCGLHALFRTQGNKDHFIALYYNHTDEEGVKTENEPQPFVFAACELTTGTALEDIYGSGSPWYRVTYRLTEEDYQSLVTELKEQLGATAIPPVRPHLTEAEIEEIRVRTEALLVGEPTPTSESAYMKYYDQARATVEAERDASKP